MSDLHSMKAIIDAAKKIQEIRHNPILILDLKEVKKSDLLKINSLLFNKHFKTLDVILQTLGGDIDAAFLYSKLIRKSSDTVNIIVPWFSKSAGTLICLIADKILMTDLSELGPLDTQIREDQDGGGPEYSSALNGFKALEQIQQHTLETLDIATKLILNRTGIKVGEAIQLANQFAGETSGTLYQQLNPKRIGEYARALEIGEKYGLILLTRFMNWPEDKARILINKLVYDYPSHGFVIDHEELINLGLVAENGVHDISIHLFELRELFFKSKSTLIELIDKPVVTIMAATKKTKKNLPIQKV